MEKGLVIIDVHGSANLVLSKHRVLLPIPTFVSDYVRAFLLYCIPI